MIYFVLYFNQSIPRDNKNLKGCLWKQRIHLITKIEDLGPVVQSVVSLTSSLRVILLTILADSI